jgi:hypothetical protein
VEKYRQVKVEALLSEGVGVGELRLVAFERFSCTQKNIKLRF